PLLEVAKTTVDSLGTPGFLPVPSFESPVHGCLLLVFLLSLRACIMSTASCSAGVKDGASLSLVFEVAGFDFGALGVAEVEYRGVANVAAETVWACNLLRELHTPLFTATLFYCDNVSAVYVSTNPVQHKRTKHIEIDIHFVRDFVAS
ncbi:ribonuclease H-like domain-containing protein, partial [Tanacetum coccineum]